MYTSLLATLAVISPLVQSSSLIPAEWITLDERSAESSYLEERANSYPIDFTFGLKIPTGSASQTAPTVAFGGYQFHVPQKVLSGNLVSFFGNVAQGVTRQSQLTWINPSAPQNVSTTSTSTSVQGGPSTSNGTVSADESRIITTTFSSGNASR